MSKQHTTLRHGHGGRFPAWRPTYATAQGLVELSLNSAVRQEPSRFLQYLPCLPGVGGQGVDLGEGPAAATDGKGPGDPRPTGEAGHRERGIDGLALLQTLYQRRCIGLPRIDAPSSEPLPNEALRGDGGGCCQVQGKAEPGRVWACPGSALRVSGA